MLCVLSLLLVVFPAFLVSAEMHHSFSTVFVLFCCYCFVALCLLTAFSLFCSVIGSLHNGRAAHVHRSVTLFSLYLASIDVGSNPRPDALCLYVNIFWYIPPRAWVLCSIFCSVATAQRGPGLFYSWGSYITHDDVPQSAEILWARDRPVEYIST